MVNSWFEDYVLNKEKIKVFIKYSIKLSVIVDNFNVDDELIHARQNGQNITITFKKTISKKLFEDIKEFSDCYKEKREIPEILLRRNPSQYVVAFVKDTLPWVNGEIVKRKSQEGHIILKTVSLFDIEVVVLQDFQKNFHHVLWPLPLSKFPPKPNQNDAVYRGKDVVFVRDLVSAMTDFFYFDFDECVRKVITSFENYFIYYKIKSPEGVIYDDYTGKKKFKKFVSWHLKEKNYHHRQDDLQILQDNILFIYHVRCNIVHNELRLKLDDKDNQFFCMVAIRTLLKIYQSNFVKNDDKFDYIFSFESQFVMLLDGVTGLNLDDLEKANKNFATPKSAISGMKIGRKINGVDYSKNNEDAS